MEMTKKIKFESIITNSYLISDINISDIPKPIYNNIVKIAEAANKQKGVYTVTITLLYYKTLNPTQDIRKHQSSMEGGFSGRSFDTKYITPVLRKMKLPAMAESGWLTRSLEQPFPYTLEYNGKISGGVKKPFLQVLDYVEKNPSKSEDLLRILLYNVIKETQKNKIKINTLSNPEKLTITKIVEALDNHFSYQYGTHNGAKLPVLAFYAIYQLLINELYRYYNCSLAPLASLTACDLTSKASGDIEIFKDNTLFEGIEIKLDKKITEDIVHIAAKKIFRFSPTRYYILSYRGVKQSDRKKIEKLIFNIKDKHGCQIIINGLLSTLKYYLRLVSSLEDFVSNYSSLVENDTELQREHKEYWNIILHNMELSH